MTKHGSFGVSFGVRVEDDLKFGGRFSAKLCKF